MSPRAQKPRRPRMTADRRRAVILTAARRLFLARGVHGVGLRDVARVAGVSLGNIYNHFPGKDTLFGILVDTLYAEFAASTEPLVQFFSTHRFPDDLVALGRAMRAMVERHEDYLRLVYVDIAEFRGLHVREHYADLAARFRAALAPSLAGRPDAIPSWIDPGVAFALAYYQFANHFVVERMIGAERHLGLDDDAAVETIARLFQLGLAPRAPKEGPP